MGFNFNAQPSDTSLPSKLNEKWKARKARKARTSVKNLKFEFP